MDSNTDLQLVRKLLSSRKTNGLLRLIHRTLATTISTLIENENLKFDKRSFLSNNIFRFGNIGNDGNDNDIDTKINYLISDKSTIREKVTAITNSIINGANLQSHTSIPYNNTEKLYEYIINQSNTKTNNEWITKRRKQIDELVNERINTIYTIEESYLWAPIFYIYDGYRNKSKMVRSLLNDEYTFSKCEYRKDDGLIIGMDQLVEPLSDYESKFIDISLKTISRPESNIPFNNTDKLPLMTGKFIYKDVVHLIGKFNRNKELVVGGISGHTLLLIELANILNINYKVIVLACIITQVPHHHSIAEIIDAMNEIFDGIYTGYDSSQFVRLIVNQLGIDYDQL